MAKVKKHANGGSYWVTVKDLPSIKRPEPKPILTGWNIPVMKPNK